jgi:hypothetical protein
MKKILFTLMTLALLPEMAQAANMLYRQSFETPIADNPEIEWTSPGYPQSQAIVTENPRHGLKSVRGNFNRNVIDPISKLKGEPFVHFMIDYRKVPALKDWYATTDKLFVSWWIRLDKCLWKGPDFKNEDPLKFATKLAYLRMNQSPFTAYYLSAGGGEFGEGVFQVNLAEWMDLWIEWYKRPSLYLKSEQTFGTDGNWHNVSFLITKKSDGNKYLEWWMDGSLMQSNQYEPDSKYRHRIVNEYVMDSIQFWWSNQTVVENSENIPNNVASKNYCNGWQIDDFQVWDDRPDKPKSPKPN